MDVRSRAGRTPASNNGGESPSRTRLGDARRLRSTRVGELLGAYQPQELRLARSFPECRGLAHEQLEDLYQETALVLLGRSFHSEEHLRHALRWGIKHRALHLHRDERRRGEILSQRAPELQLAGHTREGEQAPELAAILADDRVIVTEFLTELSEREQSVFCLMAEGLRYRAIAAALEIPVNEARKASRACERKRERFQLLYDTGRLCGFRSQTIVALQAGESVGDELAQRALAHVQACTGCRAEHRTNARRLQRTFQGQAAALLPLPALAGRLGWLPRLALRVKELAHRVLPYGSPPPPGGVREGAVAVLASGGAAAKLAAGVATVAVIAGGTIGATRVLHGPREPERHRAAARHSRRANQASTAAASAAAGSGQPRSQTPLRAENRHAGTSSTGAHHDEPGGFGFLGVPTRANPRPTTSAPARIASVGSPSGQAGATNTNGAQEEQRGGGPFSP